MKSVKSVEINLESIKEGLILYIDSRRPNSLFDAKESAIENNEGRFQLVEGCYYDYAFSDSNYMFADIGDFIVQPHSRNKYIGILSPNIFVGTLSLRIVKVLSSETVSTLELEVQSIKSGYRDDYRDMLEFITEKSTDLLLHANSPISQKFDVDYEKDNKVVYQKFSFIKSVIDTEEFSESVHRIVKSPVTKWIDICENTDVQKARKLTNRSVKELLRGSNRRLIPNYHPLARFEINSIPTRINILRKTDSIDTPENRFVKHALETFLQVCTDINSISEVGSRLRLESLKLINQIESQLSHSFFKKITKPTTLKLNSPVLQRKEGYREVLRVWLMFDLAAKLIWHGGDDIYSGGKKDIAILYEYWLFFKLLDLFQSIFDIEPLNLSDLVKETPDGLNLQLKQGRATILSGVYDSSVRKLNVRFNYNRSFNGGANYPNSGSWTTTLRPDYTLSFWPYGISESVAETQELIVHIHFDAKYKVGSLTDLFDTNEEKELDNQKNENRRGVYKNADLLKMHAYKDAIRRTGGAYVLYPGDKAINQKGFHEIIPGLGAFPVRPSKLDTGIGELKIFILEILDHFINRASQREKQAFRTFDIYKKPPSAGNELKELLPEPINTNRDLIPDETFVLIGFCNSVEQLEWIKKKKLYNFRMSTGAGSLILDKDTVIAKYLLLHSSGDIASGNLWRIVSKGPKVFSKNDLIKMKYPSPSQENYLIIQIEPISDVEFKNVKWDFRKLTNYSTGRAASLPFSCSLSELMKHVV